jgi:hypothetical protein
MTEFKVLGAAAILASVLATPAMAQQVYRDHGYRHNGEWQDSYNRGNDRDSGFWPAAAVVGGAVAPIGGDAYARRNGFVCIPGTLFRGEDGRRHICQ